MNRRLKLTTIIAPLTLAALALGGYAYTRAHAAPTCRLANGIEVTPVAVPPSDLAGVMDAKVYKFNLSFPHPRKIYHFGLHCIQNGKDTLDSGYIGVFTDNGDQRGQMTVILAPIGGDFRQNNRLKYAVSYTHFDHSTGPVYFNGGASQDITNPFKGCQGISEANPVAVCDNVLYLMGGSKRGKISPPGGYGNDITLLLRVDAITPNDHVT